MSETTQTLVFTEYGGPEVQKLIEQPIPEPGSGQIAIAVKATGVNPADWKRREGWFGNAHPLPSPMGMEASGIVTAVGDDVSGFAVGDAVLGTPAIGYGSFAQHTLLNAAQSVLKPEEVSFADAATLPVAGATAYIATHQIELEAGQTMVILGAGGGVGNMSAQIGKVHKFNVIGIASESKREFVESAGATFVLSGEGVADRVRAVAPEGADVVIDLVGGQALRDVAPVAKDPKLVISASDAATVEELGGSALVRTADALEKITGVVEYGLVDPHVEKRFSLERADEAIAEVEGGHSLGKVIIEP
ncbi:NADP-dependent oxidoreductase [Gulosibacter molinativorax]|uniref:NADP-dependent oxidoreductase n=1 Tax=Gulosibacter molinativorax TaxID=256821 RepID=A0ABT7C6S1_9MICO|nr:NADP-dependent oxidoreductase [Gulosibacter molinativorax]MDJ1370893.1 NADP-dependent oxidoreductase [Gulosibacter molinativorax]QUY62230.1 NADPH:quinone reductase and related Zn-dependent oxidoreductase [Gulosibacter molinativorax]